MKPIRNSVKALIIQNGKLLCLKKMGKTRVYYTLPGGGQNPGENLTDALKRECLEEINSHVDIYELRFVREYIGKNHELKFKHAYFHKVEFMYYCTLKEGSDVRNGYNPDDGQVGLEWLDLSRINEYNIYPRILKTLDYDNGKVSGPVYLGDIN